MDLLVAKRVPTPNDPRVFTARINGYLVYLDAHRVQIPWGTTNFRWSEKSARQWIAHNDYWQRVWEPFDDDLRMDEGL